MKTVVTCYSALFHCNIRFEELRKTEKFQSLAGAPVASGVEVLSAHSENI